jgi:hypothetical protein
MENHISVLFYARKSKKTSKGLIPIYIRITVNGQRLDQSIQRYVSAAQWSVAAGRVKGNNEQAHQVNRYLDTLTGKVLRVEREMVLDGVAVNFDNFREKWVGLTEAPRMLIEIFQQHNDQMAALIKGRQGLFARHARPVQYLPGPYPGLSAMEIRTGRYRYQAPEFRICPDLEFWLKTQRNCAHNTTMKYISNLKKIVNGCIRKGWLLKDPFLGFKTTKQEVERKP